MSMLGSERVRRSFDGDVVILKSQTPRRDRVHARITLLRARGRITGLAIENARYNAGFAPVGDRAGWVPQPSQRLICIVTTRVSPRLTERITGNSVEGQSRSLCAQVKRMGRHHAATLAR